MPHEVETMFYVREVPWHSLGTKVENAPNSADALKIAGLDWQVIQQPIYTADMLKIESFKANIRSNDRKILGVVSDRYSVVQNHEAFAFTDNLLGEGVQFETAGSLVGGKRVWLLARLPHNLKINGDEMAPYLVFSNSHDGGAAVRVAITPIRVVCQNTLNLALSNAQRMWSTPHTGDIQGKLNEAKKTLLLAEHYMENLSKEAEYLSRIKITDNRATSFIEELLPLPDNPSRIQANNVNNLRLDLRTRYYDAPDLEVTPKTAWRMINAVSDFATHAKPLRETKTYQENLFARTVEGNGLIDRAYEMLKAV